MDLKQSFSDSLLHFGKKHGAIVVLTADSLAEIGLSEFQSFFGDRVFNFGLGYRVMFSAAAGFAVYGKTPFIVGEDSRMFLKAYDQLKNGICEQNLNVKICVVEDAKTDDISLLSSLPNLRMFVPATVAELSMVMEEMLMNFGPMYLRIPKQISEQMFNEKLDLSFIPSKILKNGNDATLIACGRNADKALKAAVKLENLGLSVGVLNLISLKPLDEEKILEVAKSSKCLFTISENPGLSSMISNCLMEKWPIMIKNIAGGSVEDVAEQISLILRVYR